ncbi:Uncharacterized protein, UPF0303 family [Granulicella rosea]|uniref:UPF0303 protein SAMN05421770_103407 n=1 Tax=Granulicella rosea TaxID=474952 RepID=A0A239J1Z4_9BACT|nr:heme-degrading domain-containing protein [Granulicella rosea]SNT00056.1 Uncharacterized protein, UPF0303 family [Granulicella rosea]
MSLETDIERMKMQELRLRFERFSAEQAWELGSRLRDAAVALNAGMAFEIQVAGLTLFAAVTDGATTGMQDWIRRKRNTVMRFGKSSYAVGRELDLAGTTLEARQGLALADYATHGGGFPIRLRGTGLIGSVVASGLPQRDDHNLVVEALASMLNVPRKDVALEE